MSARVSRQAADAQRYLARDGWTVTSATSNRGIVYTATHPAALSPLTFTNSVILSRLRNQAARAVGRKPITLNPAESRARRDRRLRAEAEAARRAALAVKARRHLTDRQSAADRVNSRLRELDMYAGLMR